MNRAAGLFFQQNKLLAPSLLIQIIRIIMSVNMHFFKLARLPGEAPVLSQRRW
jgi:hypothetical protein